MIPIELLDSLRALGVTLSAAGERLRADAPPGALTPELREAIALHKDELLTLLPTPAAPQGQEELSPAASPLRPGSGQALLATERRLLLRLRQPSLLGVGPWSGCLCGVPSASMPRAGEPVDRNRRP